MLVTKSTLQPSSTSQSCRQHISSPTSVTNIDLADGKPPEVSSVFSTGPLVIDMKKCRWQNLSSHRESPSIFPETLWIYDMKNFRKFVEIVDVPSSKIENISFLETWCFDSKWQSYGKYFKMLSKHFKEIKNQIMKSINQKSYSVFYPFLIG